MEQEIWVLSEKNYDDGYLFGMKVEQPEANKNDDKYASDNRVWLRVQKDDGTYEVLWVFRWCIVKEASHDEILRLYADCQEMCRAFQVADVGYKMKTGFGLFKTFDMYQLIRDNVTIFGTGKEDIKLLDLWRAYKNDSKEQ